MSMNRLIFPILLLGTAVALPTAEAADTEPAVPREVIELFNGKDLAGLTTWLKDTQRDDPRGVFSVQDGVLRLSGDGLGYVATEIAYRDYHLTVEYQWGKKTDGGKYVRNSGILLHATGPDGGAGGAWPSCIECQLAQGCVGDFIVIRGKDSEGKLIPVELTAETELAPDGRRHRFKPGGELKTFPRRAGNYGGTSTTGISRSCSTPAAKMTSKARSASGTASNASAPGTRSP